MIEPTATATIADVARLRRVAHRLRLLDLMGHVSARLPGGWTIAVTPAWGPRAPVPLQTMPDDVVLVDLSGRVVEGRHAPPVDIALDLELYRSSPSIAAVIFGSPRELVSFGIAERRLMPVTHYLSGLVHDGIPVYSEAALVRTPERAKTFASVLGGRAAAHVRGSGVVVTGTSLLEAALRLDQLERIARTYRLALGASASPRVVSREEAAAISEELADALRRDEAIGHGALDAARYYWQFDQEQAGTPAERESWPEPRGPLESLRARVATACRVLDLPGTIVGYLEHVSHRIPGDEFRFLMSPAKRFADMLPTDIGVLSTQDDCGPLDGPYSPAPFRFYHRDLFAARPDVNAIVHTHEIFGRALVAAGRRPRPIYRVGAARAAEPFLVTEAPNLAMSDRSRSANVRLLGAGRVLQIRAHGTDFVSASIEEAAVDAIQREALSEVDLLVSALGEPALIRERDVRELEEHGPSADDWWRFYLSDA